MNAARPRRGLRTRQSVGVVPSTVRVASVRPVGVGGGVRARLGRRERRQPVLDRPARPVERGGQPLRLAEQLLDLRLQVAAGRPVPAR